MNKIIGSAKYQSAKDLGIPCLLPSFVDDCWSRAHLGAVSLPTMEAEHAVPPLHGCVVSVTGVGVAERQLLSEQISSLGGRYAADLTAACTHLLCPEEARMEARSAKLEYAQRWSIPIVSRRWLDTCATGKSYREPHDFLVATPSTAPQAWHADELSVEEVNRLARSQSIPPYLEGCHIFLSDGGHARLALLRRLIVVAGGTRYSDSALSGETRLTHYIATGQSLTPAECTRLRQWDPPPAIVHEQWLIACFVAKERVPLEGYQMHLSTTQQQQLEQENNTPTTLMSNSSLWALGTKRSSQGLPRPGNSSQTTTSLRGFLDGITISGVLPPHLQAAVMQAGGKLSDGTVADYRVMPNLCAMDVTIEPACRNEYWLKACLAQKCLLLSSAEPCFKPLPSPHPTGSLPDLCVCTTGLTPLIRDWLRELLTLAGGQLTDNLTRNNTHLLVANEGGPQAPAGAKVTWALKNGLPCVRYQWLLDSLQQAKVLPYSPYAISGSSVDRTFAASSVAPLLKPPAPPPPSSTSTRPGRKPAAMQVSVGSPLRSEVKQHLAQACEQLPSTQALLEGGGGSLEAACPTPSTATLAEANVRQALRCLLSGLVFAISQRLWHRREELHDEVVAMGGTFLWSYDAACTHYLHQGNQAEEPFREFKLAKAQGKWIISPAWLEECRRTRRRPPETDFPHHDPVRGGGRLNPNRGHEPGANQDLVLPSITTSETPASSIPLSELLPTLPSLPPPRPKKMALRFEPKKTVLPPDTHIQSSSPPLVSETLPPPPPRCYALGGMSPAEKSKLAKQLQEQQPHATLLLKDPEDGSLEPMTFTHLIWGSGPLTKSEKLMTAMAAGRWIITAEYATGPASRAETPFALKPTFGDDPIQQAWKQAAQQWRLHRLQTGVGAFAGWRVRLLMASGRKREGLTRILLAGEGQVLDELDQAAIPTHLLYSPATLRPKQALPEGVIVHSVELIADHLFNKTT